MQHIVRSPSIAGMAAGAARFANGCSGMFIDTSLASGDLAFSTSSLVASVDCCADMAVVYILAQSDSAAQDGTVTDYNKRGRADALESVEQASTQQDAHRSPI